MKGIHADYGRFNGIHAWCGLVNLPSDEQNYLQIQIGGPMKEVTGIATQTMGQYIWFHVTNYTLRFSMDATGWFRYSIPNKVIPNTVT